jgi:hypothetical protein
MNLSPIATSVAIQYGFTRQRAAGSRTVCLALDLVASLRRNKLAGTDGVGGGRPQKSRGA